MTRQFANHCEAEMPSAGLSTTVESILRSMDGCRQPERPNRSYPASRAALTTAGGPTRKNDAPSGSPSELRESVGPRH